MVCDFVTELPGKAHAPSDHGPSGGYPSRMQWQPIATAPKDDDMILVCDQNLACGFHQVVYWDAESKSPGWHWATTDGPTFHQSAFTHWMPLPEPPAQGMEARKGRDEGSVEDDSPTRRDAPHSPDPQGREPEET